MLHLLSKIFQLSAAPPSSSALMRRRERADAFCEAIRALDGTGLSHYVSLVNRMPTSFLLLMTLLTHHLQLKLLQFNHIQLYACLS